MAIPGVGFGQRMLSQTAEGGGAPGQNRARFIDRHSQFLISAFKIRSRPAAIKKIGGLIPNMIKEATSIGDTTLTGQVLKAAFDSLKDPAKQRKFNSLLAAVVLGDRLKPQDAIPGMEQVQSSGITE